MVAFNFILIYFRAYDPGDYENLPVTPEIKELFQYITRYSFFNKYRLYTHVIEYSIFPYLLWNSPLKTSVRTFISQKEKFWSECDGMVWFLFRYTPQTIELEYKLKPFIPDYIPAVGDIDAFIKVSKWLGLTSVGLLCYHCRYTPQTIELDHSLLPFIPDLIPAVGDIDAFLKVSLSGFVVEPGNSEDG